MARDLLGRTLVRVESGVRLAGKVVETEAYRGARDPASHAFVGRTRRNSVMFGQAGHAYIYLSYGVNWCLNVTTEAEGKPGAVLIRAMQWTEGLEEMMRNRGIGEARHLADGPGKLTKAFAISGRLNGEDLVTSERLFLEEGERARKVDVGPRVGISRGKEFQWRFRTIAPPSHVQNP